MHGRCISWRDDKEQKIKIIKAKILDATHLELSQPVLDNPGGDIVIAVPDKDEEERDWFHLSKERFLAAYDDVDKIYDDN